MSLLNVNDDSQVRNIMINRLSGIEGIPYQFMDTVDRRITGTSIGRKYADKIISRIPLLFLTPCKPVFMDDFGDSDRRNVLDFILSGSGSDELINGQGRYYSLEHDYAEYYKYLNCMLSSVAAFLGIFDERVNINGYDRKIGEYNWANELNSAFKSFFSAKENIIFYLDGMNSVSESYSNSTTESSLASQINGFSDTSNEIKFLFGDKGGMMGNIIDSATEATDSIMSSLSGIANNLGGGIVGSLADKGVSTVLNGGKIVFPEIWQDSDSDISYTIDLKFRSPDHDSLSIFLNILKPYCRLLCLALPRMMEGNPNGYRAPFMVKASCKGKFNINYGMITSMSVTKGAECCWNDDGLPTQIDVSLEIKDLYSKLYISNGGEGNWWENFKKKSVVENTAYMDFLANMAGLNIAQMDVGRRIKMFYYLTKTSVTEAPSRLATRFDQSISRIISSIYDRTS